MQLVCFKTPSAAHLQHKHDKLLPTSSALCERNLITATMNASPLATIPAELRNEIYSYLFELPSPIILEPDQYSDDDRLCRADENYIRHFTALAQTCRQLHQEITPIIVGQNKIIIRTNHERGNPEMAADCIQEWFEKLQYWKNCLKDVTIRFEIEEYIAEEDMAEAMGRCQEPFQGLQLRFDMLISCAFPHRPWTETTPFEFRPNHQSVEQATLELSRAMQVYRGPLTSWPPWSARGACLDSLASKLRTLISELDKDPKWRWKE